MVYYIRRINPFINNFFVWTGTMIIDLIKLIQSLFSSSGKRNREYSLFMFASTWRD